MAMTNGVKLSLCQWPANNEYCSISEDPISLMNIIRPPRGDKSEGGEKTYFWVFGGIVDPRGAPAPLMSRAGAHESRRFVLDC